ncbi:DUF1697 domain-containing protein [Streptomyces sp. NPDC050418]|uniref:DUF1697 domain-containing protein n=1 Tax=Streptomyces sp. NPDC050418 TaxID=3365612 RepID=UPI00379A5241
MTKTYAALLRGINVGGHAKIPMAELRTLLTGLGYEAVATHLQSGNAFFGAPKGGDEQSLAAEISAAIERHFGFAVTCLVRDHAYLKAVAEACPYPAAELEAKQVHVTYLSGQPDPARYEEIDRDSRLPEEFALGDRCVYLYAPDGLGRSKLGEILSRPRMTKGMIATTRNWNTVTKLVELTHD